MVVGLGRDQLLDLSRGRELAAFERSIDNQVSRLRRKVEADRTVGANWVVTGGLKPGDRVITQGVGNLKQGSAIKPVPATSPQRVGAPAGKSADKSAATKGQ